MQRSHIPNSSHISAVVLGRELGVSCNRAIIQQYVVKSFSHHLQLRPWVDMTTQYRERLDVLHFAYDQPTGALIVGSGTDRGSGFLEAVQPETRDADDPVVAAMQTSLKRHLIAPFQSEISSVNLCSSSRVLVTTSSGSATLPNIHISALSAPSPTMPVSLEGYLPPYAVGASTIFTTQKDSTIWTATLSPSSLNSVQDSIVGSPPNVISVGTSNGLFNLNYHPSGYTPDNTAFFQKYDILAMSWLSPTLLALGSRSGLVPFWDPRSRGQSIVLRHESSITGVRNTSHRDQIVVSGLCDSLVLYDVRMLRPAGPKSSRSMEKGAHRRGRRFTHSSVSCPLLRFQHTNAYSYPLGIDVNTELGLLAAADTNSSLNLYSLMTGEQLRAIPLAPGQTPMGENSIARCIRFIEDNRGRPAILAGVDGEIVRCVW